MSRPRREPAHRAAPGAASGPQARTAWIDHRWVSAVLVALILFSAATVPLETLPTLSPAWRGFLDIAEILVVAAFTVEYVARLYVTPDRWRYVFGFQGIVDLLAILPFYLSFAVDLRALRLLRVLRLLKLARYDAAVGRMARAFVEAREELAISLLVLGVIVYFAAFGIFYFEHQAQPDKFTSLMDALWWAVSTVTTVGYGDIYPITVGGRLFTFVVLIASLGLVAAPTGIFASALLSVRREDAERDGATESEGGPEPASADGRRSSPP